MYKTVFKVHIVLSLIFCMFLLTLSPLAFAQSSVNDAAVTALPSKIAVDCEFKAGGNDCDFNKLFELANTIIRVIIWFALFGLVLVIVYAGTLLALNALLDGDYQKQVDKAKAMIRIAMIGLLLTLGSWLIVNFVFETLEYKEDPFTFQEKILEL